MIMFEEFYSVKRGVKFDRTALIIGEKLTIIGFLLWGVTDHELQVSSSLTPSALAFCSSTKPGHRRSLTG